MQTKTTTTTYFTIAITAFLVIEPHKSIAQSGPKTYTINKSPQIDQPIRIGISAAFKTPKEKPISVDILPDKNFPIENITNSTIKCTDNSKSTSQPYVSLLSGYEITSTCIHHSNNRTVVSINVHANPSKQPNLYILKNYSVVIHVKKFGGIQTEQIPTMNLKINTASYPSSVVKLHNQSMYTEIVRGECNPVIEAKRICKSIVYTRSATLYYNPTHHKEDKPK